MDTQPQPLPPQSPEPQQLGQITNLEVTPQPSMPVAPAASGSPAPTVPMTAASTPASPAPGTVAASLPPVSGPAMADDVDVIEKEWVDRAEQVVAATADDPHAEEEAVEDLQIDYLKKRYGKTVKKAPEA
jgi:hypothetical protein